MVKRAKTAHEGLDFGMLIPLPKQRMTKGVGVSICCSDAPDKVPKG
mgnify:CR=1 FL=1